MTIKNENENERREDAIAIMFLPIENLLIELSCFCPLLNSRAYIISFIKIIKNQQYLLSSTLFPLPQQTK